MEQKTIIRKSLFAGTWYPTEKDEIKEYIELNQNKSDVIGCICPHAGWMYSGKVAGSVYSRINNYDTYIILGPNHTGHGANASIFPDGIWETPFGKIKIDTELVKDILNLSEFLEPDTEAHSREHCIEVQLPFIQYFNPNPNIVPIILMSEHYDICKDIANAITNTIKRSKKRILLIASTDMSHYESQQYAKQQDELAINKIMELDAEGLIKTVNQFSISMCGYFPTAIVLLTSKKLGAKKAELVKYATSGDITGDTSSVVSYAGLIIK